MNTNDLYLEYARVIEMCKGTELEDTPWDCVKNPWVQSFSKHPDFSMPRMEDSEFAVAVLEGRPVFAGDTIYYKCDGEKLEIISAGRDGDIIIKELFNREVSIEFFPDDFTWNCTPPPPKRTFTLNGVDLPCPVGSITECQFYVGNTGFYFETYEDMVNIKNALKILLTEARDK